MSRAPRKPKVGGAREGAGRPSLGADARSEVVKVSLTAADRQAVAAAAERESLSLSDWGAAAFRLALARGSTR